MAIAQIRPDWTVGTLNLVSGSLDFTTSGSALQVAAIQAGDEIITRSGLVLIIAEITGENSGTLMQPCPAGAAGSGQPLRIRFQPDGSRYNGAAADLVNLLGSGNVYEFAGLAGSADKIPYFTGVGTLGLLDLAAIGGGGGAGGWDALVGTLPERDAFDSEPAEFKVMVIDNGTGRSAVYERVGATAGTWSSPIYFTGSQGANGPANTLSIGSVDDGATAAATVTGTAPNQTLNLVLPRGADGLPGEPGTPGADGDVTPEALAALAAAEQARDLAIIAQGESQSSAVTAATQAGDAAASAATASTQAGLASASATAAANSATSASGSASTATNQAGIATTQATAASGSASAANTAKNDAEAAAVTATTQASAASGSASTATTQAGVATTQATSASGSATAADESREYAYEWSSFPEDAPVDDGIHQGFSAYHWSKKAQAIAGGGVTSVGMSVPTGLTVSGSPVTSAGTLVVGYDAGYEGFTSARGGLIDSAIQTLTAGTNITVSKSGTNYTINATATPQVNSDWNATIGVAQILNKPTLGTAAAQNVGAFATAAQGAKADSAIQTLTAGTNVTITTSGTTRTINATVPPAPVTSVNTKTGAVVLTAADVGAATSAVVTTTVNGLMIAADKVKLNGIAAGATANTGTVTSVAMSVPTGLSVTGAITTSGTLTVTYASGYQGYTTTEANKLSGIAAGAQVNTVTSVNTKTGAVVLNSADVGAATAAQGAKADSAVQPYDTVASVGASNIPVTVNAIRINGYYTSGDGGDALYKRVSVQPSHAGKIQSADGAWWELSEAKPLITMFGAIADGVTDVSDRWQEALNFIKIQGTGLGGGLGIPNNGRDYIVKKTLTFPIGCVVEVYGIGMPRVRFQPAAPDVASDFIKMGSGVLSQSINTIKGIIVWGNGATGRNCITGEFLSNLKLYDVFMFNFVGWCVDVEDCYCFSMEGGQVVGNSDGVAAGGIRLTRASGNQGLMSHVRVNGFSGANKTGLTIAGSGANTHYGMRIENCSFEFNNLGIFVSAARGLTIDTCYFEFNTEANISINGGAGNLVQSVSFVNNAVFEGGCNFINARGLTVSGNSFQHNSGCYIEDPTGSYNIGINTFTNGAFTFSSGTPRKQYQNESAWINFASTWISSGTQPSLGNGTLVFKYNRSGNTMTCSVTLTMGSTSTYGSIGYGFRLPFNVAAGAVHIGKVGCYRSSTDGTTINLSALCSPGDNYVSLRNDGGGVVGPTSPFTFAAGDKIYASFIYECV